MSCNWGCPGGYHIWGIFFWMALMLVIIVALISFFRNRPAAIASLGCHLCGGLIQPTYLRCPHCGNTLKSHCPSCSRIVESHWYYCPDCRAQLKENVNNSTT